MASCALRCWPLALDNALHTAGLPGKDMAASRFTRDLSKPNKYGTLNRTLTAMSKVYAYNRGPACHAHEGRDTLALFAVLTGFGKAIKNRLISR
jgi:hypothetical protein